MSKYKIDDLVQVALRDKNSVRPYLYVNPLQGKHIPVNSLDVTEMCKELSFRIQKEIGENDVILGIGFAETATGISAQVSSYINNKMYYQCTTRENNENRTYIHFTESHSHAVEQKLDITYLDKKVEEIDTILFLEDEVTTGNTIEKLIKKLIERYPKKKIKYYIASIINSMSQEREDYLLGQGVRCIYLVKIDNNYGLQTVNSMIIKECNENNNIDSSYWVDAKEIKGRFNQSFTNDYCKYQKAVIGFCNDIIKEFEGREFENVLILGTEEFMYPTIVLGNMLQIDKIATSVKIHSTTRSPISVSDQKNYPLYEKFQIRSLYEESRTTYLYNLNTYELVIVLTDAPVSCNKGLKDLIGILKKKNNKEIKVYSWR